jgi:hypothetical protein
MRGIQNVAGQKQRAYRIGPFTRQRPDDIHHRSAARHMRTGSDHTRSRDPIWSGPANQLIVFLRGPSSGYNPGSLDPCPSDDRARFGGRCPTSTLHKTVALHSEVQPTLRPHRAAWCSIPHATHNDCLMDTSNRPPMYIRVQGCSGEPESRVAAEVGRS